MAELTTGTVFIALASGIFPALVWLWFWLKEDSKKPEPKRLIISAFCAGMLVIPIALVLEKITGSFIPQGTLLIGAWATIEEVLKYMVAYIIAFRVVCIDGTKCLDEPIDPLIYLITVALGFSAIENALFLLAPFAHGDAIAGIITGNLRFVGATVLHVVASSMIGIAMGFSFYKTRAVKRLFVIIGIFTAILLHIFFNLSIMNNNAEDIFITFSFLWAASIVLLLAFEKIKRIRKL